MANHLITRAVRLFLGEAYYARYNASPNHLVGGVETMLPYFHSFGAPAAIDTNALVAAATGAQLPNNATISYTTANAGVAPINDAGLPATSSVIMADGTTQSVWALDVPRAITGTMTHGSSVVASTMLVSGYDVYGEPMSELFTFTATGTTKSVAGKKAFKWVKTIAVTSASDSTANTLNVGWNDVLGLPVRFADKNDVLPMGNGAPDASATLVIADDTSPATTSTGDIRGTIDFNTASDGTKIFKALVMKVDRTVKENAFGQTQA